MLGRIMYGRGDNWISDITVLYSHIPRSGDSHHPGGVCLQFLSDMKQLIKDWIIVVRNVQSWNSGREMGVDIVWLVCDVYGKMISMLRAVKYK